MAVGKRCGQNGPFALATRSSPQFEEFPLNRGRLPKSTPFRLPLQRALRTSASNIRVLPSLRMLRFTKSVALHAPWPGFPKFPTFAGHHRSGCLLVHSNHSPCYSTENGADCTISCLDTLSFILIITLYLPGITFVNGTLFSTVN